MWYISYVTQDGTPTAYNLAHMDALFIEQELGPGKQWTVKARRGDWTVIIARFATDSEASAMVYALGQELDESARKARIER